MNNTPQAPYFGTFDPKQRYSKVLFRPERAVQARELNDLQSILQHQTSVHADHIFKNGSRVSNARSSITRASYVRLQDLKPDNQPFLAELCKESMLVTGVTSGVAGSLVQATEKDSVDPATLFVQYNKVGIDGAQATFIPGEQLIISKDGVEVQRALVKCPGCAGAVVGEVFPTGRSLFFFIDEGIFYYDGLFVGCDRQNKILSKYAFPDQVAGTVGQTSFAGMKIGLDYVEDYITSREDPGLLDNALGYPNEANEGADRLRSRLILAVRGYADEDGKNFILLAKVDKEGRTEYIKSDAEYSDIMDAIAKRTYETNGNYTVRPFKLSFLNHKRQTPTDPLGWVTDGDPNKLVALVGSSVGYVLGYRTETVVETPVLFPKARDSKRITGAILPLEERAYVVMKPNAVIWPNPIAETGLVSSVRVSLFDGPSGGGNQIGSFLVYNAVLHSGTAGNSDAVYRYYFNDLVLANGKTMNDVKSAAQAGAGFVAAPVLENNRFEIKNPSNTGLLYKLPFNNVKTLRSTNPANPGTMIMTVRKKYRVTLNASGSGTISATTNQSFAPVGSNTIGVITTPSNVSTPLPINSTTLTATSSQIAVNLGSGSAGYTVTLILDVLVTNQTQNVKTLNTGTFTTASTPPSVAGQTVNLGVVDVTKILSVKIFDYTNPASPVLVGDVSDDWALVTGSTDYSYGESKVSKKSNEPANFQSSYRLTVQYQAFSHSGSAGFYTVDSYAQMLVPDVSGVTALTYETLPEYTSSLKKVYPLAASLDFRPDLITGSTLEPVVPASGSTAIFEIEYYLGRADLLCLRRDGALYIKTGLPSESPALPNPDEDSMALYQIWLKPYTYSLADISMKFIENKRYTMRDIGKLEDRIGKIEYYTVLSLLEQQTANMQTKDANGLDRFKNGFLADDFTGFKASDLNNPEFRAAVDMQRRELRPSFKSRNNLLVVNKTLSSGVKWLGSIGIRDYLPELVDEQPYATKHISVNPYFQVAKQGTLVLQPNVDTWSDDTTLPPVVTEIDSGVEALRGVADAAGILGTTWGAWSRQNTTLVGSNTSVAVSQNVSAWDTQRVSSQTGGRGLGWVSTNTTVDTIRTTAVTTNTAVTTTNTFRDDFTRQGVERTIGSRTQTYTSGETVRNVQIIPYMRERTIRFFGSKFKPNTKVYAYFDNEPVSNLCRVLSVVATGNNVAQNRAAMQFGAPMYTNDKGEIVGEFNIPGQRFFTGQKSFRITADANFSKVKTGQGDEDAEVTWGEALYFSGGLDITKQESRLNITTPTFSSQNVSEARSETRTQGWTDSWSNTSVSSTLVGSTTTTNWQRTGGGGGDRGGGGGGDPVAQSFIVPQDAFIAGLDIYFQAVDLVNNQLWVELRSLINGYPSTEVLARKEYLTEDIKVSDSAQIPHHVEFDFPVFCRAKQEYCFVVGGWTPDTRIWVARMGGKDVFLQDKTIETQPTLGSSFRSQNGSTWNAEQFEDIKYKLYVAKFSSDEMKVVFENTKQSYERLETNPIETQSGSSRVRIFHKSHGFVEGDKVKIEVLIASSFEVEVAANSTPPHIGQTLTSSTGTAVIKAVQPQATANRYVVTVEKMLGKFDAAQPWTTNSHTPYQTNYLLEAAGVKYTLPPNIPGGSGTIITGSHTSFIGNAVNGIPVGLFQQVYTIVGVDSTNSYIIDVGATATMSSRAGGDAVGIADTSVRYEVINISGSSLAYSSGESWSFKGLGHGRTGTIFSGDNYRQLDPIEFKLGTDVHLAQPMKLANPNGEAVNAVKSLQVTGTFNSFKSAYVSPVINADAFSAITITSNVDWEDPAAQNVIPNASNRFIAETDVVSGTSSYKYVSVTARMKNPASDLRILLDAYCDVNAEFDVYIKTLGASDTGSIDDKQWKKFTLPTYTSSVDATDFKEHDLITSSNMPGWTSEPFISYKIKIVGRTKNTCKPPLFKNLRSIAIT